MVATCWGLVVSKSCPSPDEDVGAALRSTGAVWVVVAVCSRPGLLDRSGPRSVQEDGDLHVLAGDNGRGDTSEVFVMATGTGEDHFAAVAFGWAA